jgi:hypothetical protein
MRVASTALTPPASVQCWGRFYGCWCLEHVALNQAAAISRVYESTCLLEFLGYHIETHQLDQMPLRWRHPKRRVALR